MVTIERICLFFLFFMYFIRIVATNRYNLYGNSVTQGDAFWSSMAKLCELWSQFTIHCIFPLTRLLDNSPCPDISKSLWQVCQGSNWMKTVHCGKGPKEWTFNCFSFHRRDVFQTPCIRASSIILKSFRESTVIQKMLYCLSRKKYLHMLYLERVDTISLETGSSKTIWLHRENCTF